MQLQNTASEKAEFLSKTKKPRNIPNKSQFLYFFPILYRSGMGKNYHDEGHDVFITLSNRKFMKNIIQTEKPEDCISNLPTGIKFVNSV